MENLLLDLWIEEVGRYFCGHTLTGIECSGNGYLRLFFGPRQPRLHFHLKPQCIWYCFSSRLEPKKNESRNGPLEALLCPGRLLSICRVPQERILQLVIKSAAGELTLAVELIPSSPNLLVLNAAGELLWMLDADRMPGRRLSVASTYRIPGRPHRLALDVALQNPPEPGLALDKWLQRNVEGMSPLLASELVHRSNGSVAVLVEAREWLANESPFPSIYTQVDLQNPSLTHLDPWRQILVSPWRLKSRPRETEFSFPTANDALECFARIAAAWDEFQGLRKKLLAPVAIELKRLRRAFAEATKDAREMEDADRYRRLAELLLCHLGELRHQGMESAKPIRLPEIRATDHYAAPGSFIQIPVDADKSLQANAEAYFKRYRKAQRGARQALKRLELIKRQISPLETKQQAILSAVDLATLSSLDEKAPPPLIAKIKIRRPPAPADRLRKQRTYVSTDNFEILVGQSAANNEEVTFRLAAPADIWLHVADYTGSHVIVRNPSRRDIPHTTLLQAAGLAAYYSAARKEPKVDVRYTERKFVYKLKGAARGMVRLQRFKTLLVRPSRQIPDPDTSSRISK
jgi:predicted ribosome quality control (RQC) complex YloA/Tae2 family protein